MELLLDFFRLDIWDFGSMAAEVREACILIRHK